MTIVTLPFLNEEQVTETLEKLNSRADLWRLAKAYSSSEYRYHLFHVKEIEKDRVPKQEFQELQSVSLLLFSGLFESLRQRLEEHLGEEVNTTPDHLPAGFSIFPPLQPGEFDSEDDIPLHLDILEEGKDAERRMRRNEQLSVTIALSGEWGKMGLAYKPVHAFTTSRMSPEKTDLLLNEKPTQFHAYRRGEINLFPGFFYHRFAGLPRAPQDPRRITLQAFLEKHDGLWRMTC